MRNRIIIIGAVVMLIGLLAWPAPAQRGTMSRNSAQIAAHAAANAEIVVLTGTVTAVNLAAGQGMPSIILHTASGDFTVMVGPYRLLAESKLEIKVGQSLEVKAFPDPRVNGVYAAVELKDSATGAVAALRNEAGIPAMGGRGMGMNGGMMRGRGPGQGMFGRGACADCADLNLEGKTTLIGVVQSVDIAAGKGSPSFTLSFGATVCTIITGPYWLLQQADFTIAANDRLSVVAYPSLQHEGTYVAAEIQNLDTQKLIKLRGDNGMPLGMRGGRMRGIRR